MAAIEPFGPYRHAAPRHIFGEGGQLGERLLDPLRLLGFQDTAEVQRVTMFLEEFVADPNVTVIVEDIRSFKVFIVGEVAKPGAYALKSDTSVLQALAMAGGFDEAAVAAFWPTTGA